MDDLDYAKMARLLSELSCSVHHRSVVVTPTDEGVTWSDPCCDEFAEILMQKSGELIDEQLFENESGSETI